MSRTKKLLSSAIAVALLACFIAGIAIADDSLCTIKINYLLSDGTKATSPWTTTVARGSNVSKTVKSPTIAGYEADKTTVDVSCANIQTNMQYTVTYSPAEVTITVKHYKQNVAASGYDLFETVKETGTTGSAVGTDIVKDYEGFTALPFDSSEAVAADGGTVVEIYYDRNYYLISFDLQGGSGIEPLYARYGSPISVETPTKAGYTFAGWSPELPATVPAENTTVTANWTSASDKVSVNVAIWGEKANSEEYEFVKSLTLDVNSDLQLNPEDFDSTFICAIPEHTHSSKCSTCTHTSHSLSCYGLSSANKADLDEDIWEGITESASDRYNLQNHIYYVYDYSMFWSDEYFCYVTFENGQYVAYKYEDVDDAERYLGNQTADRYAREIKEQEYWSYFTSKRYDYFMEYEPVCKGHTHSADCFSCGQAEHTHTSACYTASTYASKLNMDSKYWKFVNSDVTKNADGTYTVNLYYDRQVYTLHFRNQTVESDRPSEHDELGAITAKWGADITYSFGHNLRFWSREPDGGGEETVYLRTMPAEDRVYYEVTTESNIEYGYYRVANEDGTGYDRILERIKRSTWGFPDVKVEEEDFLTFEGYTLNTEKSPKEGDFYRFSNFFYERNEYTLSFVGYDGSVVNTETVKYDCHISQYKDYVPEFPEELDPELYEFAGWYLMEQCYEPSKVNFETQRMPLNGLKIYAHYVRKQVSVNAYLTKEAMAAGSDPIYSVSGLTCGSVIDQRIETPVNGEYAFAGWYYIDENGSERGFDFSMPIERNINVYAAWTSGTAVQYAIHYALESGELIADDTVGYAIDGATITVNAKTDVELRQGYTVDYLPQVGSCELKIGLGEANEFTFVYTQISEVEITTRFINKATGEELKPSITETARKCGTVTVEFDIIPGYVPDAYSKTVILSSDSEKNVVTFYYTQNSNYGPVQVIHYVENLSGGYDVYLEENIEAERGTSYTPEKLSIEGFSCNEGDSDLTTQYIGTMGWKFELYYERNLVEYTVKYVASDDPAEPGKVLWSETREGYFGMPVSAAASEYTANNTYCLLETETSEKSITLGADANSNEIIFCYYPCYFVAHVREGEETTVETVRFCGTDAAENLTQLVSEGYIYGGAFTDESCTTPYGFGTGENGLVFTNTLGATYYVREVSESYLTPKTYAVSHKVNGEDTVYQLYLMSNTDSCKYQYAGFEIGGNYALTDSLYGTVNVTKNGELYNQLYVKNGVIRSSSAEVTDRDEGYIAMYKLSDEEFKAFKEGNLEFKAFWVTLDGVLVTGTTERNCTYVNASTKINVENTVTGSDLTWYTKADTQSVALEDAYLLNSSDETAPVTPDTQEKTESDIPAAPEMTYTGEAEYLRVRHSYTMLTNTARLISAVDLTDCVEAGFIVNGVTYKCESFSETVSGYSARYLFGASVDGAMLMSIDLPLEGFGDGQTVNITPYIVTADGTTLYGETCAAIYRAWQGLVG